MGGKAGKSGKGGLFGRLKKQLTEPKEETLKTLPSSQKSLTDPHRNNKAPPPEFSAKDRAREASLASFESDSTAKQSDFSPTTLTRETTANTAKTSHFPKIGRRGTRGLSYEGDPGGKGTAQVRKESTIPEGLWNLDTDLSDMGGIVDKGTAVSPGDTSGIFTGLPEPDEKRKDSKDSGPFAGGNWDAPDSWGVKKQGDDVVGRLPEIDEDGDLAVDEDDGTPYFVRVFRADSTFATLSTSLSTTVSDIVQMLGKKSFLQHDLGKYQIVMKKNDLQRQLDPGERPIAMQKRLLEQVGYEASDHIEEIGREDNSYLVKFTFLPAKHALDKDLGFNKMQKFSHVDLQGRGLDTIPITLYQKSPEIISLNLSRNLALDVPKDFIQGCINLREIKYVSNEAWRLPPSFSLASRLTVLDISNNRLEQLDHAGLEKLTSLVSIKMSNNRLSSLPPYFGGFKQLRSLNMSSNNFSEFPDFIGDLKSLVDLDVSFNTLSNLPNVGKLKNLERIWATNNNLAGAFNQEFETLENLKEIDVRFNGITNIDSVSGLPKLEQLLVGHNAISTFTGCFQKLRTLLLDHCPMTTFDLTAPVLSLTTLNIASAKLSSLKDSLFENMPNLTKFILDKNHFVNLPTSIGKLRKLEHFSVAKNPLSNIPASIGCLTELRYLNLREANLGKLPAEIWYCLRLETLNLSSNVLENFPKPGTAPPPFQQEQANGTPATTPGLSSSPSYEELGKLEDFGARRPSQASGGLLSVGSSPAGSTRKGSIVSVYGLGGRKASVVSRTPTDGTMTPVTRKDSNLSQKIINTFAGSMRYLYLADNRLQDEVFREISMLPELRVLNMSYNELTDLPQGLLRRWPNITELYLSGNELTSLPSDDLEEIGNLKVLQINGNKFQVLPAELCKVQKLAILDVGSNSLKYNVSNWPYDWNWNWNRNLKFLNFSGNKRLEIKPAASSGMGGANNADLTNFSSLTHLRVLGLMDVTLTIPSVPDQTEDRRVRTTASIAGSINYGMADTLGRNEHLSTIDLVVPSFRSNQIETLIGMFDGQALSSGGSKVAKYLHENFVFTFTEELAKVNKDLEETPSDALRRSFLSLNKDMATAANASQDTKEHRVPHLPHLSHRGSTSVQVLSAEDMNSGGVATVLYIHGTELYVANVGDAQSMLIRSDGGFKFLTRKHDPAEPRERQRIREAGGYVSRQGKLNDVLEISRAFGYFQMVPSVTAAPSTLNITLSEQDEMILIATKELWDFVTPDVVVDVARADRQDLMLASQKLRDLAMAFGATSKIMVMMIGVSDLRKQSRNRFRNQSVSIGGNLMGDDNMFAAKRGKRQAPGDSRLARLDEVEAPIGHVAIIFTDIKNSTNLWETFPVAMKTGISMHNELMRRQLRIIGGYEVKTEGDAFMVSFQTATAALLWCFTVQQQLLEQPWPSEILETLHCQERVDTDGNVIFRGLSVRMGIHWGQPVCEPDPVTKRMDYFGPMVNRAARVSGVADGGQIYVSSDFIAEIQRTLETYAETDRSGSTGSEETINDDLMGMSIRKDLRQLSNQGFEVKDLGERKLKGLENPETIYLMYPHSLAGRLAVQPDKPGEAENAPGVLGKDSQLSIDTDIVWKLWNLSLRLEMLCSSFENPNGSGLKAPETTLLDRMKNRGGEITDTFLVNFIEHQVCRVEVCTAIRGMSKLANANNRLARLLYTPATL
jgi:adenylate cyclase